MAARAYFRRSTSENVPEANHIPFWRKSLNEVPVENLQRHHNDTLQQGESPLSTVQCPFCRVEFRDINDHRDTKDTHWVRHYRSCPRRPVTCTFCNMTMADACFRDYHHRFCISNRGRHSPEQGKPTTRDQFQFANNIQSYEKAGRGPKGERELILYSTYNHAGLRSFQRIPVLELQSFAINVALDEFPQSFRTWYKPLYMVAAHTLKQELGRDPTRTEQEEHITQTLLGDEMFQIVAARVPLQPPLTAAAAAAPAAPAAPAPAAPAAITVTHRYRDIRVTDASRGSPQQDQRQSGQRRDHSSNWTQRPQSGRSDWSDWRSTTRDRSSTTRWPQSGSDWQQSARGRDSGAPRHDAPRSRPRTPSRPPPYGDRNSGEWSWREHPDPNRSRWSWTEEF
jgi:hypothetical protein